MNFVAFIMIFLRLSETKQKSLEELDYVFAVPTTRHVNYQVGTIFPYWAKTQILRRKGLPAPSIYQTGEFSGSGTIEYSGGKGYDEGKVV